MKFSIVIIASNESANLRRTLPALKNLTDDVIIVENNSIDDTVKVAETFGARVLQHKWIGYGPTKNYGNNNAKYDWILSLDADEVIDEKIYISLKNIQEINSNTVYNLTRIMVWNGKILHFGGTKEHKIRLFNRKFARWNENAVHESLLMDYKPTVININGLLLHYSYKNLEDAIIRNRKYANAFDNNHNKSTIIPPKIKAIFTFLKSYIFLLGFLHGKEGYEFAYSKYDYVLHKALKIKKKRKQ